MEMNAQVRKYKSLLKTMDHTLDALNGERVSVLIIGSLEWQRIRFVEDPVAIKLIDTLLNHIDLYHNKANMWTLKASGEKVTAAMADVVAAGQLSMWNGVGR